MSYYFLLTTSVFLNWASELNNPIQILTKRLLHRLKQFKEIHEDVYIEVVDETDKSIYEICKEMSKLEMYDIIKAHYKKADNSGGDEQTAVVNVARRASNFHQHVIIVNGSNAISPENFTDKENIKIMNEVDAYIFLIKNVHAS